MISAGMISHDELAWIDGASDWRPLHTVLGLSQPPPIPKPTFSASTGLTTAIPRSGPKGVGGWLVFFCVGLTILAPPSTLGLMAIAWDLAQPALSKFPTIKSALILDNLASSAILIYGFIVGCIIWSGSPQGRDIARRFLLIRLFVFIGLAVVALLIMGDLPSEVIAGKIGGVVVALFREGVYFTIWWLYFKKSKRIRNTYGYE